MPLASCDVLFSGMFPADVAQITAQVDLSAEVPAANAASFSLAVLKLLGTEYVLLFSSDAFDSTKTHLFVLSPALQVLNRYTLDDLTAVPAPGIPFMGNTAVTRLADNQIVIGNLRAVPGTTGLDITGKLPGSAILFNEAVGGPAPGNLLWTNFRSDSTGTMVYEAYDALWAGPTARSHPIGRSAWVRDVFTDPEDSQYQTALIVFEDDSSTQYFIQVPKEPDLAGGWPAANLLDNPAYLPFTKTQLDSDSIAFTSTGIVAYDYSSFSWIRFLPSAPNDLSKMRVGRRSGLLRSAFSYAGGYYCTFDQGSRVLTRYEDWW